MELVSGTSHVVAVIGGAVAGSEAAKTFAKRGVPAVVFEQNARPYGKIEDGLPRWHEALRTQEYAQIAENLTQPGVFFVPQTTLGRDVTLQSLLHEWKFSAVVLAHGAWRDRPLGVAGVDDYIGKGFLYQNALVHWYNHSLEAGYTGPRYELPDGAIVVGGGLASIDVVKILNLEVYARALKARGIDADMHEMERHGINTFLDKQGLTSADLGVKGCTLYYRRRKKDMPLAAAPDNATPEQLKKFETVREKVMDICMRKYLVRYEECHATAGLVTEGDRLAGLRFRRTEMKDGKLLEVPDSEYEVRAPLVVSSIGSIPVPMQGVPMKGELYDWADYATGELRGAEGVFGLGNVLTGKGNIKSSRHNAEQVSQRILGGYLGVEPAERAPGVDVEGIAPQVTAIHSALKTRGALADEDVAAIRTRLSERLATLNYDNFADWLAGTIVEIRK